jgi:tripartite-type tricarboxylate transporter receptor subunit TctC
MVHPDVPARSVAELVSYARANPGKLSNGTGNSAAALLTAMLSKGAGIAVTNVPYKGEVVAVGDLAAGRLQMMFIGTTQPAVNLSKEGKLRALAVLLQGRSPLAPEIPTLAEAGYPGIGNTGWLALFGPPKLPGEIANLLARTVNETLAKPEVRAALAQHAFEIATTANPAELGELMKAQSVRMKGVYADAGIEPQ